MSGLVGMIITLTITKIQLENLAKKLHVASPCAENLRCESERLVLIAS